MEVRFLSLTPCLWGAEKEKQFCMNTARISGRNSFVLFNFIFQHVLTGSILLLSAFIHDGENVPNQTFPNSSNTEVTNQYLSRPNWFFFLLFNSHPSIYFQLTASNVKLEPGLWGWLEPIPAKKWEVQNGVLESQYFIYIYIYTYCACFWTLGEN